MNNIYSCFYIFYIYIYLYFHIIFTIYNARLEKSKEFWAIREKIEEGFSIKLWKWMQHYTVTFILHRFPFSLIFFLLNIFSYYYVAFIFFLCQYVIADNEPKRDDVKKLELKCPHLEQHPSHPVCLGFSFLFDGFPKYLFSRLWHVAPPSEWPGWPWLWTEWRRSDTICLSPWRQTSSRP